METISTEGSFSAEQKDQIDCVAINTDNALSQNSKDYTTVPVNEEDHDKSGKASCETAKNLVVIDTNSSSNDHKQTIPSNCNVLRDQAPEKVIETSILESDVTTVAPDGHGSIVAAHYNALQEKGLLERNRSRIVYLRNFNNWIKSLLIAEYMDNIKASKPVGSAVRVMDMCCGKGGDLLKWRNADINHLICADIAETSVKQCKMRYEEMDQRQHRDRRSRAPFTAEFLVADCTKVRLREKYKDPTVELDLVSCQFSFHYCFESLPQAECMLINAAECLRAGGYFIGTIPDANDIVKRYRVNGSQSFGNSVYTIEFDQCANEFPLFGAKYNFSLMDVVNCPEFLVHFPTLERLARKHGLELVAKDRFENFFNEHKEKGRNLLRKMQAVESYPPFEGMTLQGDEEEYVHAKEFLRSSDKESRVGTLSKSEWEAASLYMVFAFRKMKRVSWDAQGKKAIYEQIKSSTCPTTVHKEPKRTVDESGNTDVFSPKRFEGDDTT